MTRSEIAAIACSAVACVGTLFAVSESRRSAAGLAALEEKFAKLETAPAPAAPVRVSDQHLERELESLRSELHALSVKVASGSTSGSTRPPVDPTPVGTVEEQKAREEAAAREQAWVDRVTGNIVEGLVEKLELSKQQESTIRTVVEKEIADYRAVSKAGDQASAKKAIDAFIATSNEKIRVVLTPEQQAKFEPIASARSGIFSLGAKLVTEPLAPRMPGTEQPR